MKNSRLRFDSIEMIDGRRSTAWAYNRACNKPRQTERLVILTSLHDIPGQQKKHKATLSMTHQVDFFHLDKATGIDFDKSLWEQPTLSPMLPARLSYQFMATIEGKPSDMLAEMRISGIVTDAAAASLPYPLSMVWTDSFADGFDVSDLDSDPSGITQELARERGFHETVLAPMQRDKGVSPHAVTSAPAPPRFRQLAKNFAYTLMVSVVSIVSTAVFTSTNRVLADYTDQMHDASLDVFYREWLLPDGSVRHVRLAKVKGIPGRYTVELLAASPVTVQPNVVFGREPDPVKAGITAPRRQHL